MAKYELKNRQNIEGDFFVDTRCIGCSVCKNINSNIFELENNLSYVKKQAKTKEEIEDTLLAIVSCPVSSIGTTKSKDLLKEYVKTLPKKIEENIYFCSFTAKSSYGATAYFIKRGNGNILIDSPKFDKRLVENIEVLGGIKYIYLTHKDDIADFEKYKDYFNSKVIFHEDDFNKRINNAEITLSGEDDFLLDDDIRIIVQRGHTKGHTVLLYKDKYLFSGDNLAYNPKGKYLYAFKRFCWFDWEVQLKSLKRLVSYSFSHVFAGHGENYKGTSKEAKELLINYLKRENTF